MKKFITFIPRQDPQNLLSGQYAAMDNPKLDYHATCFPILPVMNGYTEPGEEVQLIALDERYDNSGFNPHPTPAGHQYEAAKIIEALPAYVSYNY